MRRVCFECGKTVFCLWGKIFIFPRTNYLFFYRAIVISRRLFLSKKTVLYLKTHYRINRESTGRTLMKQAYCSTLPFWHKLSENAQDRFCANLKPQKYHRGERINGGISCKGVIFIVSGCLRVYMLSESGRDITLFRLYQGDVCMLSASCVLPQITFDVFVDAEEDCECYVISGSVFAEIAEQDVALKMFAYETALTRFSEVMWVVQQIHFMKVDRRLAVFLWDEMMRTGNELIPLTQEQIAKYMSSAREVVSRMLKYFASEKIVKIFRKGVMVIDKKRLKELALAE